jgi:uncharacterized lipoprotein YddW (UPF0748 family)
VRRSLGPFVLLLFISLSSPAQQYRAFWADAFHEGYKTPPQIEQLLDNAIIAKANAIFMQARRRGDVYYLKSVEPQVQEPTYNPNFDALDFLIQRAHARGIEVHAWFVVSRLWTGTTTPADPRHAWNTHGPEAEGDDFWLTVSSVGRNSDSIDLGHPAAALHVADLVTAVPRDIPISTGSTLTTSAIPKTPITDGILRLSSVSRGYSTEPGLRHGPMRCGPNSGAVR